MSYDERMTEVMNRLDVAISANRLKSGADAFDFDSRTPESIRTQQQLSEAMNDYAEGLLTMEDVKPRFKDWMRSIARPQRLFA